MSWSRNRSSSTSNPQLYFKAAPSCPDGFVCMLCKIWWCELTFGILSMALESELCTWLCRVDQKMNEKNQEKAKNCFLWAALRLGKTRPPSCVVLFLHPKRAPNAPVLNLRRHLRHHRGAHRDQYKPLFFQRKRAPLKNLRVRRRKISPVKTALTSKRASRSLSVGDNLVGLPSVCWPSPKFPEN